MICHLQNIQSMNTDDYNNEKYTIESNNRIYSRNANEELLCGEIRYAYLPELVGGSYHMQQGLRPVLIVSNNMNNRAIGGNVQIIPFTSKEKKWLPTHVTFKAGEYGLLKRSILLAECETQIPACYIYDKIGYIDDNETLVKIANAMIIQHGILSNVLQNN